MVRHPIVVRPPYFFQDPVRCAGLVCAVFLMCMGDVPLPLMLLAVALAQVNGIAMVLGLIGRGWSTALGRRARACVLANNLAIDSTNTALCTLVGAMLLMRLFGPPQLVLVLGVLSIVVALVPDVRVFRVLLPVDPREASRVLERGYFFRDPIKLGALCGMVLVCFLDRTSLAFLFVSMIFLQLNAYLVLVDKYLSEVEASRRWAWMPSRTVKFFLARDGQRLALAILPMAFVPLRLGTPEGVTEWVGVGVATLIIVPDIVRLFMRGLEALWTLLTARAAVKA